MVIINSCIFIQYYHQHYLVSLLFINIGKQKKKRRAHRQTKPRTINYTILQLLTNIVIFFIHN